VTLGGGAGITLAEIVRTPAPALRAAAALLLAAPALAGAHEVVHEVDRGRAVAVQVRHDDGAPLGDAAFEVFAPGEREVPHLMGRTDRRGWLAFVPDAPGSWRVRVFDDTGHGLDVAVEVTAAAPGGPPAAAPGATARYVLRPIAGVVAIAAVFGALVLLQRRRAAPRAR
jgi:nickel transport protein